MSSDGDTVALTKDVLKVFLGGIPGSWDKRDVYKLLHDLWIAWPADIFVKSTPGKRSFCFITFWLLCFIDCKWLNLYSLVVIFLILDSHRTYSDTLLYLALSENFSTTDLTLSHFLGLESNAFKLTLWN